jgi:hypothetical protein
MDLNQLWAGKGLTELAIEGAKWLAIADGVLLLATVLAFVLGWAWRFRLVGVTAFTLVLVAGLLGFGVSLRERPRVEGAVAYKLVYDTGATQAVIAVPADIDREQLVATLKQAAIDLYSPGRVGSKPVLTIRARSISHPQEGVSQLNYLGQIERSLTVREDPNPKIQVF